MYDQAERLRQMVPAYTESAVQTRVITVTSGKGGVGKSNFSLNFAIALAAAGKKVVVMDADVGFANIDVLMGKSPRKNLADLIHQRATIWDVLEMGPYGIYFIAGGSGLNDVMSLQKHQFDNLINQLGQLQGFADYLLIDTGAGLNEGTLRYILASDDVFVVSTPEPTAIADAYALIKLVARDNQQSNIQLVINRATSIAEARHAADKLTLVSKKFLSLDLKMLGFVMDDPLVSQAVKEQVPFFVRYPESKAARCIDQLRKTLLRNGSAEEQEETGVKSFLSRMVNMLRI